MILLNPVVLSVIVLAGLCLVKIPVFFSLIVAAIVAGVTSGIPIDETMKLLVGGMGANSDTALSYILLGALAYCINKSGAAEVMARQIGKLIRGNKFILAIIVMLFAVVAETFIPIHIAFIPILIPPLLGLMNKMKVDRRMLSISFGFGLKAPYITLPIAYGAIFHELIITSFKKAGLAINGSMIISTNWIIALIMAIGVTIGVIIFSRDREYKTVSGAVVGASEVEGDIKADKNHWLILIAGAITVAVQILTKSLPLGALCGLIFIVATGVIKFNDIQDMLDGGIHMMGFIAFVMLLAAGYANVITNSGAIDKIVESAAGVLGGSKLISSYVMILLGLLVTLGIGTSFGTVPIISAIYVPLAMKLGFSPSATILLVTIAAVCGDAGSPASDTTLGPTAGLGVDKQHDHIRDTCIPQIIFIGLPLIVVGGFITQFL
ncbi:Na+/H+ antiporter NhaC family protein [Peptoniphilus indolicus]|uniref:GntP family gluconate:proton (H+) symporter n=2 Tax=Peptoniphilus indolicus TaxID=33030 RepID=G4D355_9FIRM|nr:Na+/H+ antiporter NhaC family protein [Peptoniphilus indolicus]EGY80037.1 GntP family gluconate:proton (H+) symporter [Peptoniphilus indolicus ATCC 29427]SUB75085.1 Uncharacterized conserved protein [Peptoniphilus indolicus]